MFIPRLLHPGDKIAITAASSPANEKKLRAGIRALESLGLKIQVFDSCHTQHAYLAGTDDIRLKNLHTAFADQSIKGIFMARGGYGAGRLLPYLDYGLIKNNPKVFVGFSDVTALHIVFNQICKMVTFHGPMPGANLNDEADALTIQSLKQMTFAQWLAPQTVPTARTLFPGNAAGILTGGNLSLIAASLGTPFEINTRGRILFMEEIEEEPYKVDRLFLQLKQAGKFRDAKGIILGDFSPETPETLNIAIQELIIPENKPTICDLPCGHTNPTLTLPLGVRVSLHPLQIHVHLQNSTGHTRFLASSQPAENRWLRR